MTENDIVDRIEWIRRKNNAAWMGLLRLALTYASSEARDLLRQINDNDRQISELFGRLTHDDAGAPRR